MATAKITYGRRSFIKSTVLAGGGLMLGFNWVASTAPDAANWVKNS